MTHSNSDMRAVAEAAAKAAVDETLLSLGINVRDPLSAQQDFVVLRDMRAIMKDTEFQADLAHLRKWRKSMESAQTKGFLTLVGMLVSGAVGLMILGLKGWKF